MARPSASQSPTSLLPSSTNLGRRPCYLSLLCAAPGRAGSEDFNAPERQSSEFRLKYFLRLERLSVLANLRKGKLSAGPRSCERPGSFPGLDIRRAGSSCPSTNSMGVPASVSSWPTTRGGSRSSRYCGGPSAVPPTTRLVPWTGQRQCGLSDKPSPAVPAGCSCSRRLPSAPTPRRFSSCSASRMTCTRARIPLPLRLAARTSASIARTWSGPCCSTRPMRVAASRRPGRGRPRASACASSQTLWDSKPLVLTRARAQLRASPGRTVLSPARSSSRSLGARAAHRTRHARARLADPPALSRSPPVVRVQL